MRNSLFLIYTLISQNSTQLNATSAKQQQQWCGRLSGMCFAMNIPSNTATDYYIAITAPINPAELNNVTATLLPGTGVHGTDSYMTANIHVLNGMTWPGGQLDRTVKDQPFTWAFSPNSPKGGASGDLKQHVAVGSFKLDMTATIGAGGVPTIVSPEATWGWSSTVIAHAVIMGLAWVGALPAGAIIIRFLNNRFPKPAFIHQIVQLSGAGFIFIAFWIGVGASNGQHFKFGHQSLGLILFLALFVQGGLGWYHHKRYLEDKPKRRRWFTHVHLWLGRLLIFLALINIGLGIQLFGNGPGAQAGWYIFAIAIMAGYAFFYWQQFYRQRKIRRDAFDPTPFERNDSHDPDSQGPKPYEPLRPVNVVAMSDSDLGTYRSEYYSPLNSRGQDATVDEYGARTAGPRPTTNPVRPGTAAPPATGARRRYDIAPTPVVQGPYPPPEPLRPAAGAAMENPFLDDLPERRRPMTVKPRGPAPPYPASMGSYEEVPSGPASNSSYFV